MAARIAAIGIKRNVRPPCSGHNGNRTEDMCANAQRQSFRRIAFLGNTGELRNRYAEALKNLQLEIAEQNKHHPEPASDADNPEGPSPFDPFK